MYETDMETMRKEILDALGAIYGAWRNAAQFAMSERSRLKGAKRRGHAGPIKAIKYSKSATEGIIHMLDDIDVCDYVSTQQVAARALADLVRIPSAYAPGYEKYKKQAAEGVETIVNLLPRYLASRYTTQCGCKFEEKEYTGTSVDRYVYELVRDIRYGKKL